MSDREGDAANIAAEHVEGLLTGMEASVDVTSDGWVSIKCDPQVAWDLRLRDDRPTEGCVFCGQGIAKPRDPDGMQPGLYVVGGISCCAAHWEIVFQHEGATVGALFALYYEQIRRVERDGGKAEPWPWDESLPE